jgi:hypothetical protein
LGTLKHSKRYELQQVINFVDHLALRELHKASAILILSHYPLCDNVLPYSIGIHTVWVRFLDNGEMVRFSGIWFNALSS